MRGVTRAVPTLRFSVLEVMSLDDSSSVSVSILVTVPGFEDACSMELQRKLGVPASAVSAVPGNVTCRLDRVNLAEASRALLRLRSAEHLYATLFWGTVDGICGEDGLACLQAAVRSISESEWMGCLALWAACTGREGGSAAWESGLKFKVLKKRSGTHAFSSTELAQHAFAAVAEAHPAWTGDIDHPELTLVVRLSGATLHLAVPLTGPENGVVWKQEASESGFVGGGPSGAGRDTRVATPLKPPIAFGLVASAGLEFGDILVDPFAGCGTVAEVAALEGRDLLCRIRHRAPRAFCISGDFDAGAVACTATNARALEAAASLAVIDVVRWDASRLPLKRAVADRVTTDLPFGRKCGSRAGNKGLYPAFFFECARVLRGPGSRAAVLSADRGSLRRAATVAAAAGALRVETEHHINIGGLNGVALVMGPCLSGGGGGKSGGLQDDQKRTPRDATKPLAAPL